ncbi:alanyl-tRNA editing protein [Sporosarcina sp. NCCP-2222]|uniref:alanyl-tRNA editing protein n=1 Tax=Sporosarcina sp. NCCP-2222 TaxID=2935073 RepID=UPI002085AAF7|nr:DHHA1 domain-containing protein [Sporosarcina sp. NCCP-2222]GKV56299.1 alanyl-tRNA editing protein [Sporosarcina sp. NCCP-2222]
MALHERFYYQDAYQKEFTAEVLRQAEDENGRPYVVLSNTAFYPTGGGQPHDTGSIQRIAVVDVEEVDSEIRHYLAEPLQEAVQVEGVIDWERRFDHMQQHAGQHILTASFVELFGFPTVSFHLGKELVSIDLDVEEVTEEQLRAAERLANDILLNNRPIETKWVTEEELDQYALRKQLAVTDEIRLVIIPDFDYNGCGGTHPKSTGEVGLISILGTEKQKRKTRVHFVCGGRVLKQLHKKNAELREASQLLSAPEDGVSEAIAKLQSSHHILEKSLEDANETLLAVEAKELADSKEETSVIKAAFTNRTVQELQKLARLIAQEDESAIVFLVAKNDTKLQFVAARGAAVSTSMKQVASGVLPLLNGKGGGNDAFVQGGGERTMLADELLEAMEKTILQ